MSDKPIPESYWVVPGSFLAGGYPISSTVETTVRANLEAFLEAGIDTFFDLTSVGELPAYLPHLEEEAARYGISIHYQRITIQDRGLPAEEKMAALLDAIDTSLAAGKKIYLHCWGGIGRTGTTVGCWLVKHGLDGKQALTHLNELYRTSAQSQGFPRSPETEAQVRFILTWSEHGMA